MNSITTDDPDRTGARQCDDRWAMLASRRQRREVIAAVVVVSFLTILARTGISGAKVEMAPDLLAWSSAHSLSVTPFSWFHADYWPTDGARGNLSVSAFFFGRCSPCLPGWQLGSLHSLVSGFVLG
jgi:hypothetical protein